MKPVCNFCGDAVVYHLNGSRNKCEKCGNGVEHTEQKKAPETEDPCGFSRWVEKMKQLF